VVDGCTLKPLAFGILLTPVAVKAVALVPFAHVLTTRFVERWFAEAKLTPVADPAATLSTVTSQPLERDS